MTEQRIDLLPQAALRKLWVCVPRFPALAKIAVRETRVVLLGMREKGAAGSAPKASSDTLPMLRKIASICKQGARLTNGRGWDAAGCQTQAQEILSHRF